MAAHPELLGGVQEQHEEQGLSTNALDLEEDVKKLFKILKDMKVDRKCNAYAGLLLQYEFL